MEVQSHYLSPSHPCGYLPGQLAILEYIHCHALTLVEYGMLLEHGWRRFGRSLFRPRCPHCSACQSLRVAVAQFTPNRSQSRNVRANTGRYDLQIGQPQASPEKLRLHDQFHQYQSEVIGWPRHPPKDAQSYFGSFVDNPFPTEEWCYYHRGRLVGVGYVDNVKNLGLSAIYFFHDPTERKHGLGTWNVLQVIQSAEHQHLPFVYLGYYVEGCRSLEYKARFQPNQILDSTGQWHTPDMVIPPR